MPEVRVLEKSYINLRIVEPGEIIDYDGELGSNLELVNPPVVEEPVVEEAPVTTGKTKG